jgi:hypothetical protein
MLAYLKRLLWDQAYATQQGRAVIILIASLVTSGIIPIPAADTTIGWYVQKILGACLAATALFMRAGDKNSDPNKPATPSQ